MNLKTWAITADGRFKIVPMSSKTLPEALDVMRNSFWTEELVSNCCEVSTNAESIEELVKLGEKAAEDGISLVAIEAATGLVAAFSFNKLLVKNNMAEDSFYEDFYKNSKQDSTKALLQFILDAESKVDVFDYYNVDCVLEISFLGTKPEYRQQSLALLLLKSTMEIGKSLLKRDNVKFGIDNNSLSLEPIPKAVCSLFSTFKTQNAGRKLGFSVMGEMKYDECFYKNRSYASKITCETKSCTIVALKL